MRRVLPTAIAFFAACGIVVGAIAAYTLLPPPGGVLSRFEPETEYPVTSTDYFDERVVPLVPVLDEGSVLRTSAAGVVTESSCVPGTALSSGSVAVTLDGKPVVALVADRPFYRDLGWGDEGDDVDGLRRALVALGHDITETGAFDGELERAVTELQQRTGTASSDGVFRLTDFLWVPPEGPAIASCDVKIGQYYSGGETLATTTQSLRALRLASTDADTIVPGERTLGLADVEVTLPENGVIDDPDDIHRITSMPRFNEQLSSEMEIVSASSRLTHALRVAALPPASLFDIEDGVGCVASTDGAHTVTIVGTNLGLTLATFDGVPPRSVLLEQESLAETCNAD